MRIPFILNMIQSLTSDNITNKLNDGPYEMYCDTRRSMMKTIINENQRGLLFKNGQFVKMLNPGKYHTFINSEIEVLSLDEAVVSSMASSDVLLKDKNLRQSTLQKQVKDHMLSLRFINGKFYQILASNQYIFFTNHRNNEFIDVDIQNPYVDESIPKYIFEQIDKKYFMKIEVLKYQKALLYFNNQFIEILDNGTYYFWKSETKIDVTIIDTRVNQLEISGQEILTQDKVTLRINFVCQYKIIDYIKVFSEINDYKDQLYIMAQLVLREYIGKYKIDEILENKDTIADEITEVFKKKARAFYIEVISAGIKDIILPGEVRNIMNTVLIAQKKAQANVITRREEVASTRSLLNTARLMEENKTLYKLKQLEYLERICQNVGEISVNSQSNLLSQLNKIIDID